MTMNKEQQNNASAPVEMPEDELLKSLEALEKLAAGGVEETDLEKSAKAKEKAKDEDSGEADDAGDSGDDEDAEKSFAEAAAEGSENIRKAIEVSDFLSDLVDAVGNRLEKIEKSFNERLTTLEGAAVSQHQAQREAMVEIAKSFGAIRDEFQKSFAGQEDLKKSIQDDLKKSIDALGDAPMHRRKSLLPGSSQVIEKSFGANDNVDPTATLSKSFVTNKLFTWAQAGQNGINSQDVLRFESSGELRPEVKELFRNVQ